MGAQAGLSQQQARAVPSTAAQWENGDAKPRGGLQEPLCQGRGLCLPLPFGTAWSPRHPLPCIPHPLPCSPAATIAHPQTHTPQPRILNPMSPHPAAPCLLILLPRLAISCFP